MASAARRRAFVHLLKAGGWRVQVGRNRQQIAEFAQQLEVRWLEQPEA